jgi:hypothetical protein
MRRRGVAVRAQGATIDHNAAEAPLGQARAELWVLISIFFVTLGAGFGTVTVSTPFVRFADPGRQLDGPRK